MIGFIMNKIVQDKKYTLKNFSLRGLEIMNSTSKQIPDGAYNSGAHVVNVILLAW